MEYEEIKKKVADTASTVGKKAGELANKAKIRFALANLQSDLDELYEKLGKLHYESIMYGTESGSKEASIMTKIDTVREDMEILKAELDFDVTKKSSFCGKCGGKAGKDASFCPFCGEKLD